MSHRQIVDALGKRADLSHRPFRVFHLPTNIQPEVRKHGSGGIQHQKVSAYLLQMVQVLLIDPAPSPLEAAALRHFHVHGADVLLAIVLTLLPQRAEAAE